MSCPYYWYNYNSYACRKSGKDTNSDIYYKYCQGYDYGDCPIYKGNDTSGCFLTSACVEAKGLTDDCHELTVLRQFRDGYLKAQPCGQCEINEYYHIAPVIVERIKALPNANEILEQIYIELVRPCVELIEKGNNESAHDSYRRYVLSLTQRYLTEKDR